VFRISFWLGLVVAPAMIWSSYRDMTRKGPRKIVYAVNEKRVIKKILRGEDHPLWNAASAPPSLAADGLGDSSWTRADPFCVIKRDEITFSHKLATTIAGGRSEPIQTKILRSDFADEETFTRLAADFEAVMTRGSTG